MRFASISGRLILASAVALPIFLALGGYGLDRAFARGLLEAEREQLQVQIYLLLGALELEGDALELPESLSEPRYGQIGSGLYAVLRDASGVALWRSPSARLLDLSELSPAASRPALGACSLSRDRIGDTALFRYRCAYAWQGEDERALPFMLDILHEQGAYRAQVQRFRNQLILLLAAAAVLLVLLQLVVLRFGLRPLGQLVQDLGAVEAGRKEALEGDQPKELQGVARSLNQLLVAESARRERYRNTLGDLAHSLKTPLALLRSALDTGAPEAELRRQCDEQVERMGEIVAHQLARASGGGQAMIGRSTRVAPVAQRLAAALEKIHGRDGVTIEVTVSPVLAVRAEEAELMEMLGNLLENACKYGGGHVAVRARSDAEWAHIEVLDDGPGIEEADRARILERGKRADETVPGQGIGLAVATEIAQSHGGRIDVRAGEGDADGPGACFVLSLPRVG